MTEGKYLGIFELIKELDGMDDMFKKSGLTDEKIFSRKIKIFMVILTRDCQTEEEIFDKLLGFFENHDLWDVLIRLSECKCLDKKCKCRYYRDIFIGALEKDAEMRKI